MPWLPSFTAIVQRVFWYTYTCLLVIFSFAIQCASCPPLRKSAISRTWHLLSSCQAAPFSIWPCATSTTGMTCTQTLVFCPYGSAPFGCCFMTLVTYFGISSNGYFVSVVLFTSLLLCALSGPTATLLPQGQHSTTSGTSSRLMQVILSFLH